MATARIVFGENNNAPDSLASISKELDRKDKQFFFDVFFSTVMANDSGLKYLSLTSDENPFETDTIIVRSCYEHMQPHIHAQMSVARRGRIAVTGTPGIGKSIFGVLLARDFVIRRMSVVYWMNDSVYLFSWDEGVKAKYGLQEFVQEGEGRTQSSLHAALWVNTGSIDFSTLIGDERMTFVHDPKLNDRTVALTAYKIDRIVFILSYGHDLISYWTDKNVAPHLFLYLPLWTLDEATRGAQLLPFVDHTLTLKLFEKFGGAIRGWRTSQSSAMEKSLREKVMEVVKKHGDNVLSRTLDARGSIVHMDVEFDERRPVFSPTSTSSTTTSSPNEFFNYKYIFGSQMILEAMDSAIMNAGDEALKLCLNNWAAEPGFEGIYGGIFGLRCHRVLARIGGEGTTLRARRVFRDDRLSKIFKITLPGVKAAVRYKGNDPKCLTDSEFNGVFAVGSYFWPYSSNHPTYDSAMLVYGSAAGESSKALVALLFQMTVSGASGLPRRPNHAMKQWVRKDFEKTFASRLENFVPGSAITAFVVPTECFESFAFQAEAFKEDEDVPTQKQPDYQLVIEMPGFFSLSKNTINYLALPDVSASHKRKHRFILRDNQGVSKLPARPWSKG